MTTLRPARYFTGWLSVGGLLSLLGMGIDARVGLPGLGSAILEGVWVAAVADVVVFALLGIGLLGGPERFLLWWGLAAAFKLIWFGTIVTVAGLTGSAHSEAFLLAVGAAFLAFSTHQVVLLVRIADQHEMSRRKARGGLSGGGEHVRTRER